MAASGRMARALTPPGGRPRAPRPPVGVTQGWLMLACIVMLLAGSLFTVRIAATHYFGSSVNRPAQGDQPCAPGLPTDKCR